MSVIQTAIIKNDSNNSFYGPYLRTTWVYQYHIIFIKSILNSMKKTCFIQFYILRLFCSYCISIMLCFSQENSSDCAKVDAEWINEHKLNSTHSCHRSDRKIKCCSNCYWRNNKKSTYFIYSKVDASVWKNAKCIWYEATIEPTDAVMQPDVFSAVKCTGILASIAQNQSSFQHLHCTQLTFTRRSLSVSTLI